MFSNGFPCLVGFSGELVWGSLDDVVMGGVSESTFQIDPTGNEYGGPTGLFKGTFLSILLHFLVSFISLYSFASSYLIPVLCIFLGTVSTANNGGFTSIRTRVIN